MNGNTTTLVAAIVAVTFLALAAVVGLSISGHGLDGSSATIVTLILGFAAPTVVGLFQLLNGRNAQQQRDLTNNTLSSVHEAVQSQGTQLDGVVSTLNKHDAQITAIQGAIGADKRSEDPPSVKPTV